MTTNYPRSYLFVPGNRAERFAKAEASGAEAVILDLEDAVPAGEKGAAREAVAAWVVGHPGAYVRINAAGTEWFDDDVGVLAGLPGVAGIVVPKAASLADLVQIRRKGHADLALLPLIETMEGMDAMDAIAAMPGVQRLLFGTIDFQLDMGIWGDGEELDYFRSQMVAASRRGRLAAPVDGVTTVTDAPALITRAADRSRRFGFGAKLCIHPRQIDPVHRAFAPSPEQLEWARRVVAIADSANGSAVKVDGAMVDLPVVARAHALLAAASTSPR
jgi:citrate lyase subunit beta/citryl-CoA lyase